MWHHYDIIGLILRLGVIVYIVEEYNIWGEVSSFYWILFIYQLVCLLVLWLLKKKNMDKIWKLFLARIFRLSVSSHIQCCKIIQSWNDLKVKVRTNVWTKTIAIPIYKVRTTAPCEYGLVCARIEIERVIHSCPVSNTTWLLKKIAVWAILPLPVHAKGRALGSQNMTVQKL